MTKEEITKVIQQNLKGVALRQSDGESFQERLIREVVDQVFNLK